MNYSTASAFNSELSRMRDILDLMNYRRRTTDSYLQSIFECCEWLDSSFGISIDDASVDQLRSFLLHLKRSKEDGGLGFAPRSVNIYNCAIKKYSRYVLRRPLSNDDLPTCRVDHPLPKVPSKAEMFTIIRSIKNLKHKAVIAITYGAALRLTEVVTLRFRDISFSDGTVTISEEVSKNRYAGIVELPVRLKEILLRYYRECFPDARPDDWLFPGAKEHSHISKGTPWRILKRALKNLGWESRGYSFHSVRHAHALHYYQAGADLFQVQQRLRHRSITSTLIYVRLDAKLRERSYIDNPFDDTAYEIF